VIGKKEPSNETSSKLSRFFSTKTGWRVRYICCLYYNLLIPQALHINHGMI